MIMDALERALFHHRAPQNVRYIAPMNYAAARGETRKLLDAMETEFQVAPPLTMHMSSPELMAGVWSVAKATLLSGALQRGHAETIATAVSAANNCSYCFDVHAGMLHATGDHKTASQIRSTDEPYVMWARATLTGDVDRLARKPFDPRHEADVIGVALVFHYINRMVNVFLVESPLPVPKALRGLGARVLGATFAKRIIARAPDGPRPDVRPAILPADLRWATGSPAAATAFVELDRAARDAGSRVLSAETRGAIEEFLVCWSGQEPPLGSEWVEEALDGLGGPHDKARGELALLTAVASNRVTAHVIDGVRATGAEDTDLIEIAAWGAHAAMRRIGTNLTPRS